MKKHTSYPREVEVRVRYTFDGSGAFTMTLPEDILGDKERVERWATDALYDGIKHEEERGGTQIELVYRLDARCKLRDKGAATPWCRIHDSPMRRDDPKRCYDVGADGKPSGGYAR